MCPNLLQQYHGSRLSWAANLALWKRLGQNGGWYDSPTQNVIILVMTLLCWVPFCWVSTHCIFCRILHITLWNHKFGCSSTVKNIIVWKTTTQKEKVSVRLLSNWSNPLHDLHSSDLVELAENTRRQNKGWGCWGSSCLHHQVSVVPVPTLREDQEICLYIICRYADTQFNYQHQ